MAAWMILCGAYTFGLSGKLSFIRASKALREKLKSSQLTTIVVRFDTDGGIPF